MKEFIRRTIEEIGKAWRNPKYKYLIISALLSFLALVLLIGIFSPIKPNPNDFYQKWKAIVENSEPLAIQKLSSEYDKLWDKQAKIDYEAELKKGIEILGQDVKVEPAELQAYNLEEDATENYIIRNIEITVNEQTGGQRKYNCSLTLNPKGLTKSLKIVRYRQEEIERKSEEISPKPIERKKVVTQSRSASIRTELPIRQALGAWLEAWEQEDLERYMDRYAAFAEVTRVTVVDGKENKREKLTKQQLREKMKKLFKKYDEIRVEIEEQSLKIDETQLYAEANVEFLQDFTGIGDQGRRRYRDYGLKQLKFINEPTSGWKIYEEDWTLYPRVLVNR